MPGVLAALAAMVVGGLADELIGRHLPVFLRIPLFAAISLVVYRYAHSYIKELRDDLGR